MYQSAGQANRHPLFRAGRWRLILVVFTLLFFLRLEPFFSAQLCFSDFDETEVGILAKDLLDGPVAPVGDYLLHTNGFLIEGFFLVPFFGLGGKTLLMIRLFALLISLLTLLAAIRLAWRTSGATATAAAMGFLLFGIEAFYRLGVAARPSHKEFCLLLFWQLLVFTESLRREDFLTNRRAFLLGMLNGFALFFSWQNAPVLIALGLAAVCCLPGRQWRRLLPWTAGAALMFLPGWFLLGRHYGLGTAASINYAAQWRSLWETMLPTAFNVDQPALGLAAFFLIAAAWAALAVRTLVRRRKLHPADEAPALRDGLALDWFLLFFPPLWLAATLRQGWPLTAENVRYALPFILTVWLIPTRLIIGKKSLIAGMLLMALLFAAQWRTLPQPGQWLDASTRLSRLTCAAGYRGYWYPTFLQNAAARYWSEEIPPDDFPAQLGRIAPPWRTPALRGFGHYLGLHPQEFNEAWETAIAAWPADDKAAWLEGFGVGAIEQRLIRRVDQPAPPPPLASETDDLNAYYRGFGRALFGDLIGLTPSPPRLACMADEAPCEPRDAESLRLARRLAGAAPDAHRPALVAGFGMATADRELTPDQVTKVLANLLPENAGRLSDFYFGYGIGLARFRATMTERWFEPSGLLCPRLPDEWQEACKEGFDVGLGEWGLALRTTATEYGPVYHLSDAGTAPFRESP